MDGSCATCTCTDAFIAGWVGTLWRASYCHHGQRLNTHLCLRSSIPARSCAKNTCMHAHYWIPPPEQWHGGVRAAADQGCPTCTCCGFQHGHSHPSWQTPFKMRIKNFMADGLYDGLNEPALGPQFQMISQNLWRSWDNKNTVNVTNCRMPFGQVTITYKYLVHLKCSCGLPGVNCHISLSLHTYLNKKWPYLSLRMYIIIHINV
jgi:hypothetical protein